MFYMLSVMNNFVENISKPQTIIGLVVALLGFTLMFLSSKCSKWLTKCEEGEQFEKWKLVFKMISLGIVIVGCCVVMFIP